MIETETITIGNETLKLVDGDAVRSYYSTTREELGVSSKDINASYIYGLYDELVKNHPDNMQRNTLGTVVYGGVEYPIYEYVISTGEYNTAGNYGLVENSSFDAIKKPKYLIESGIHGNERAAVFSAYRFARDVLEGNNIPASFKEGVNIHIVPLANPCGFCEHERTNGAGTDINRDFDFNKTTYETAAETQAIANWLRANTDADVFIDLHNSGFVQENVAIIGDSSVDSIEGVKKIALQGIDRVIPFWKDVIGYPEKVEGQYVDKNGDIQTGVTDVVFAYSADYAVSGTAYCYASNKLGIPSLGVEFSAYYGDYSEWMKDIYILHPETIAMGADALGNMLMEFYKQSFVGEVNEKMKIIDGKLDALLNQVNSGFRVESGVYTVETDLSGSQTVKLPCTSGAKILTFTPDDATYSAITSTTGGMWLVGYVGQAMVKMPYSLINNLKYGSYMSSMNPDSATPTPMHSPSQALNDDGFKFVCGGLKAGTYNWTAYYWNE